MKKSPFIWLGSGRAAKRGVARHGALLDQLARAGLPVPDGAILLDELFRIYLQEGIVEQIGETIVIPDPVWLLEVLYRDVRFPRLRTTADLSLIPADDCGDQLPPFDLAAGVDLENADQMAAALRQVWSYPAENENFRRDILLMKQVQPETAGMTLLSQDGTDVELEIFSGERGIGLQLELLGPWQRPSTDLPPYARRLQQLLRGLRRTLGKGDWVVSWADDGEICWVVGVH